MPEAVVPAPLACVPAALSSLTSTEAAWMAATSISPVVGAWTSTSTLAASTSWTSTDSTVGTGTRISSVTVARSSSMGLAAGWVANADSA